MIYNRIKHLFEDIMGRYSSDNFVSGAPVQQNTYISSNPYTQNPYNQTPYGMGSQPQQGYGSQQNPMANWPTSFPNPTVVLDLHGVLIENVRDINSVSQMQVIPGALEAVKQIRLKGHKAFILADYPGIARGKQTQQGADAIFSHLMNLLGQAGCMSIDGALYNTSDQKQDLYAKPNIGMINRAKSEMKMDLSNGYCVGDSMEDLVMATKAKLTPVLILTGNGQDTLKKLDSFTNRELKQKTKVFPDLLSFVASL